MIILKAVIVRITIILEPLPVMAKVWGINIIVQYKGCGDCSICVRTVKTMKIWWT